MHEPKGSEYLSRCSVLKVQSWMLSLAELGDKTSDVPTNLDQISFNLYLGQKLLDQTYKNTKNVFFTEKSKFQVLSQGFRGKTRF